MNLAAVARDVRLLKKELHAFALAGRGAPFPEYRGRPVDFAREVLKVEWTPKQVEIALAAESPPCRVLCKSANNVGKTMFCAGYAVYWFLTRSPAIVITTAPKLEQVKLLLWKEIRSQSRHLNAVPFAGPESTYAPRGPGDFMLGTTARDETSFKGHHGPHMLFLFDEAVGVEHPFWEAAETMFSPPGHAWICIFNPTDSASAAYQAEHARGADDRPTWSVVTMSALDHPNILAELDGRPPPIPSAIRLGRLNDRIAETCEPVTGAPNPAEDIEWPPGSGKWVRPGPVAEAALVGRWPSQATGVWSDALWRSACSTRLEFPLGVLPAIGCDVARFGDDWTAIHCRWGGCSLRHESHNGWSTSQTAGRLKELAREVAAFANSLRNPQAEPFDAKKLPVYVDDDGVGGGVTDQSGGYNFVAVTAKTAPNDDEGYPDKRSELWFVVAEMARKGRLDFTRLDRRSLDKLRLQLLAPTWKLDWAGKRVVDPKAVTKKKLGRSPDDADGCNLAFAEYAGGMSVYNESKPQRPLDNRGDQGRGVNPWRR